MKKIISHSVSVVLALAMLFAMAMLFSGCEDHGRKIGSYSGNNVVVDIYKNDENGSLYCKINDYSYPDANDSYESHFEKIKPNASQIKKITLFYKDIFQTPGFYVTITLTDGKWGEIDSKIQTDLYNKGRIGYKWVENGSYTNISFYPA